MFMVRIILLSCFGLLLLAGCASYTDLPAGTVLPISRSPVIEQQEVVVEVDLDDDSPSANYRVGAGDVLSINIDGRPEMGSPEQGSRIDGAGQLHLPMVGTVLVSGMTVSEVQAKLREKFSVYLNDPWVVVEIVVYKSQPLYLIGEFRNAGTYYMDRPQTLLEGLSLGGGVLTTANLVVRDSSGMDRQCRLIFISC